MSKRTTYALVDEQDLNDDYDLDVMRAQTETIGGTTYWPVIVVIDGKTPDPDAMALQKENARLKEALRPFAEVAKGIPENWPESSPLTFVEEPNDTYHLAYHGWESPYPTIGLWRALLATCPSPASDKSNSERQTQVDRIRKECLRAADDPDVDHRENAIRLLAELGDVEEALAPVADYYDGMELVDMARQAAVDLVESITDMERLKAEAKTLRRTLGSIANNELGGRKPDDLQKTLAWF